MTVKRMKYIFVALLAMACKPDNTEANEFVPLAVDPAAIELGADGGEKTFTVTASEKLYLVPGDGWVTARQGEKSQDHKTVVTVAAEANNAYEERSTRISVVAGDEKLYVEVTQLAKEPEKDPEPGDNAAWKMVEKLGAGWNLGNQMDAHSNGVSNETCWGNPKTTQALFDSLKEYGFKSVRIPVTWLGHIGDAPDYIIAEDWMARVEEIVGYAENARLNAIINIHHDGADSHYWLDVETAAQNPQVHAEITNQITNMWTQIAERFKDKGEFLIFESFNEIHDGGWGWGANRNDGGKQYQCLNEWNQAFVDAVRSTGGKNSERYISVAGYCANPDMTVEHLVLPEDTVKDRLMVAVHCYDPYDYCLSAKYSEWGHTGVVGKKDENADEMTLEKTFVNLKKAYVDKGIPVYMGEMGCVNRATAREQAFQQYYLEYFAKLAKTYGVASFIWDNGAKGSGNESHAFVDHATGAYCSEGAREAIEAFLHGMNEDSSDYTLETVYNSAPL